MHSLKYVHTHICIYIYTYIYYTRIYYIRVCVRESSLLGHGHELHGGQDAAGVCHDTQVAWQQLARCAIAMCCFDLLCKLKHLERSRETLQFRTTSKIQIGPHRFRRVPCQVSGVPIHGRLRSPPAQRKTGSRR